MIGCNTLDALRAGPYSLATRHPPSLIVASFKPYCKWGKLHQNLITIIVVTQQPRDSSLPQYSKVWPGCCCINESFCTTIQGQNALEQVCQTVGVHCHILVS